MGPPCVWTCACPRISPTESAERVLLPTAESGRPVKVVPMSSVEDGATLLRERVWSAGSSAGANARIASAALVSAVGRLAEKAIDRVLLTDERVTSAADGKRLLAGDADTEALAGDIQRVVVLAVPVVR